MTRPVFPDLSAAVASAGQGGFQAAMSEAIATWLGAERRGVLQYSRHALPHYLVRDLGGATPHPATRLFEAWLERSFAEDGSFVGSCWP